MNRIVTRELLGPLLARVGSLLSGFLVGAGAGETQAEQVAVGAVALVLICIDLAVGHFFRKTAGDK